MTHIENLTQLKEFLSVYNTLTERCFGSCVRDFSTNQLLPVEAKCTQECIDKQMRVNRRLMVVFADLAPKMLFKQQEAMQQQPQQVVPVPTPPAAVESANSTTKALPAETVQQKVAEPPAKT
ncbi:unnamed protein product [Bursaphelenchus xylophilus]|uniref:Mitochondrial import inner membrane translocase subunit n=1 Tax=Bursaphelenchus xylophilus TaxID=6326 RepID=A0A1I7RP89_BURXY|nr:unnamed protein product [Bursaphelenchus xylophilus]CAG9095603.1 unnamed protein product [Bursaphelenchus xylophilus]